MKNLELNQMEGFRAGTATSGDGRPCFWVGVEFIGNFPWSLSFWLWDDVADCWAQP